MSPLVVRCCLPLLLLGWMANQADASCYRNAFRAAFQATLKSSATFHYRKALSCPKISVKNRVRLRVWLGIEHMQPYFIPSKRSVLGSKCETCAVYQFCRALKYKSNPRLVGRVPASALDLLAMNKAKKQWKAHKNCSPVSARWDRKKGYFKLKHHDRISSLTQEIVLISARRKSPAIFLPPYVRMYPSYTTPQGYFQKQRKQILRFLISLKNPELQSVQIRLRVWAPKSNKAPRTFSRTAFSQTQGTWGVQFDQKQLRRACKEPATGTCLQRLYTQGLLRIEIRKSAFHIFAKVPPARKVQPRPSPAHVSVKIHRLPRPLLINWSKNPAQGHAMAFDLLRFLKARNSLKTFALFAVGSPELDRSSLERPIPQWRCKMQVHYHQKGHRRLLTDRPLTFSFDKEQHRLCKKKKHQRLSRCLMMMLQKNTIRAVRSGDRLHFKILDKTALLDSPKGRSPWPIVLGVGLAVVAAGATAGFVLYGLTKVQITGSAPKRTK